MNSRLHWVWRAAIAGFTGVAGAVVCGFCGGPTLTALATDLATLLVVDHADRYVVFGIMLPWLLLCIGALVALAMYFTLTYGYGLKASDGTPCCHNCGYNLTGNVSGVCPECGETIGSKRP